MNPLTIQARRSYKAEERSDKLLAIVCGIVFALLCVAFFI